MNQNTIDYQRVSQNVYNFNPKFKNWVDQYCKEQKCSTSDALSHKKVANTALLYDLQYGM